MAAALAVAAWPGVLDNIVSLDWRIGSMRPAAYSLSIAAGLLTVSALFSRTSIDRFWVDHRPARRNFLVGLVALSVSVVIGLLAAEIVFRLFNYPFSGAWAPRENAVAQFDPEVGWSYVPHASAMQRFGTQPLEIPMYFSDLGARAPQPHYQHYPTAPTILFVGCSFTMGHGVLYEDTFAHRVGAALGAQAVNLGVQAYGTDQTLLLMKRHFRRFDTRVVVYTFIDDHIERNANYDRRMLIPTARFLGTKPLFGLDRQGKLYLRARPRRYKLATRSPSSTVMRAIARTTEPSCCRLFDFLNLAWTQLGPVPDVQLTEALITEMRNYVEANNAKFLGVYWRWGGASPQISGFLHDYLGPRLVDSSVASAADWEKWRVPGDGHPDATAHGVLARLIEERLRQLEPDLFQAQPVAPHRGMPDR